MEAYAGAARRCTHLATVFPQLPSGHRPGSRGSMVRQKTGHWLLKMTKGNSPCKAFQWLQSVNGGIVGVDERMRGQVSVDAVKRHTDHRHHLRSLHAHRGTQNRRIGQRRSENTKIYKRRSSYLDRNASIQTQFLFLKVVIFFTSGKSKFKDTVTQSVQSTLDLRCHQISFILVTMTKSDETIFSKNGSFHILGIRRNDKVVRSKTHGWNSQG